MVGLLSLGVPAVAETAVPAGFRTGRFVQGLRFVEKTKPKKKWANNVNYNIYLQISQVEREAL